MFGGNILKKIYYNEELSESEINVAREEIKEYWLIGTEEYDEYLKNNRIQRIIKEFRAYVLNGKFDTRF